MLRNKLIAAAAVTATAAIAAPAFAGSPAPAAPEPVITAPAAPVVMGNDWTGGYAGLNLGYGKFKHSDDDGSGAIYGAQAGYNYDFGDYILGGEVSYDSGSSIDTFDGIDIDNTAALKLKAGYDMGSTMIYGTAGAERVYSNIGDDTGWVAGFGVDHMITPTVSVGAEYLHHHVDDFANTNAKLRGDSLVAKVDYHF